MRYRLSERKDPFPNPLKEKVGRKITAALEKTIAAKVVTYDLARQMEGAKKVKCSEFASAIIENL